MNAFDCPKLAFLSRLQGEHLANGLVKLLVKKSPLKPFKPMSMVVCVLVTGPDGGVTQMGRLVLGDFVTRKIKAATLMFQMLWEFAGLKPPQ